MNVTDINVRFVAVEYEVVTKTQYAAVLLFLTQYSLSCVEICVNQPCTILDFNKLD